MKIRHLFGVLFALHAAVAHAENWQPLANDPGKYFFELDLDSVARTDLAQYSATWRSGISMVRPYFVKTGTVNCFDESLTIATSEYVETDPVLARYRGGGTVTDYVSGKSISSGRSSYPLSENERVEQYRFPGGGPENRMILKVCQHELEGIDRTKEPIKLQAQLGCGGKALENTPFCGRDQATLEAIYLMLLRLGQTQRICRLSEQQTGTLQHSWLVSTVECSARTSGCGLSLIQMGTSGLGDDLARSAAGLSCSYVQRSLESAERDQARRESTTKFQACVKRSIPALDDRLSSADVVARAIYGACQSLLIPMMAQSREFMDGAMPGLIGAVLEYRKQAQRPQVPKSKPKPGAVQT